LLRAQPLPAVGTLVGTPRARRRVAATLALALLLTLAGGVLAPPPAQAMPLPDGFSEEILATGFQMPVSVQFSPDGRIFVAERGGLIKVLDGVGDTTPQVVADLRTEVYAYYDRGLLGFALDPGFPANPYAHVLYTYDAAIGGTAPRWNDQCPDPPGDNQDGCVASGRLSRLRIEGGTAVSEQVLINDWCTQFPSHATGDLRFGTDGSLYVSAGEGASFTFVDYGQRGSPRNPCGDPPGGTGAAMTAPTSEGGAMRSQDLRTTGDPVGLDGTVLRVDPATGAGLPDNPLASSADPNARRIVAYGLRNPFRMTFRPGTDEIWLGDVGWTAYEEINRIQDPTGTVRNFGWPCYEGAGRQPGYDGPDFSVCERLYAQPDAVTPPWFTYTRDGTGMAGEAERCVSNGLASTSGVSFYTGGSYPASYRNALFFADYSRSCIYVMPAGADGLPDPSRAEAFASAPQPVYLTMGPDGNLWYVNLGGTLRRIVYAGGGAGVNRPPAAALGATPTQGSVPLTVRFDASGSHDPDAGDTIAGYEWDLDGDGGYGDAAGPTPSHTYQQPGTYTAAVRVTDSHGAQSSPATVTISAGNTSPSARIVSPTPGTTWQPGDPITFAGDAGDAQDGSLPASSLSWTITLQHCATGGGCHAHPLQDLTGVAGGSFPAPDHEYPSYLELRLTATDSGGLSDSTTLRLDPRTVDLSFTSEPSGLALTVGPTSQVTPFTRRVIVGSRNSVSAPTPQALAGTDELFDSWSDGGAASHDLTAPASPATFTARYRQPDPSPPANQPPTVAARGGVPSIPLGASARIGGTVAPASPGEAVALDQWSAGGWRQLRSATLDQVSTFTFTVTPSGTGTQRFRVRKPAGDASAGGTSPAVTLKVYRTVIAAVRIAGPGLNGEYLELRNSGSTEVNLATWTVHHARLGWTLRLRPYALRAGQRVRVYSGPGASGNGRLFLGRRVPVWRSSRTGDLVQVLDGYRQVAAATRYQRT
jgi:glucose/arabinose dehydrogenase